MRKPIKITLLLLFAVLFFTTCKKYPKNYLWFKDPKNTLAVRYENNPWKLVYYSVNDIDSTNADFLKVWREQGFFSINSKADEINFKCYDIYKGFWILGNKNKNIVFAGPYPNGTSNDNNSESNPNYVNQRYIFFKFGHRYDCVDWKIDKLCKDEFRIITEYNGIKYEIHFK